MNVWMDEFVLRAAVWNVMKIIFTRSHANAFYRSGLNLCLAFGKWYVYFYPSVLLRDLLLVVVQIIAWNLNVRLFWHDERTNANMQMTRCYCNFELHLFLFRPKRRFYDSALSIFITNELCYCLWWIWPVVMIITVIILIYDRF